MRKIQKVIVAVLTVLSLFLMTSPADALRKPVKRVPASGHIVPVPSGLEYQVTTELNYAAFPYTVKTAMGTYLTSYKTAPSHNSHTGALVHRRSADGVVWEDPYQMPNQTTNYTWGHGGIGVETAEQGGRVYLLLLRLHWVPNTSTIDEVRSWLKYSDDDGLTWQLGPMFPPITTTGWYPSSLLVLTDGSLLAAGYNTDGWVRYFRSTNRGASWVLSGAAKPSDRGVGEGTLTQLPDGRVLSFLRSDVAPEQLLWTISSDFLNWSTPVVAAYQASGLPNATVVDGHVAVLYRGYVDGTNVAYGRPTRVLMFDITETGIDLYRDNIKIMPGEGRFLYGNFIESPTGWLAIVGVEGPGGQNGGSAEVTAVPVRFALVG